MSRHRDWLTGSLTQIRDKVVSVGEVGHSSGDCGMNERGEWKDRECRERGREVRREQSAV